MLHVRNVSTKAEVEKLNEYTAHYHAAMHELSLLSSLDNEADLQAYFAAVVLPLRRAYAWGVPSTDALQAIAEASPLGSLGWRGVWQYDDAEVAFPPRACAAHVYGHMTCELTTLRVWPTSTIAGGGAAGDS